MNALWLALVRFRTWLFNGGLLMLLVILPDMLNSPEILAIIPPDYQRYVIAAALIINIWMRPRPAVVSTDLEASRRRQ
jgi:hypothetical protein